MTIVDRIQMLCNEHGTTLVGLERTLDFGRGTIRKWINSSPSIDKIGALADYFHTSIDYLINGGETDEVMAFAKDMNDLNDSDLELLRILINALRKRERDAQRMNEIVTINSIKGCDGNTVSFPYDEWPEILKEMAKLLGDKPYRIDFMFEK